MSPEFRSQACRSFFECWSRLPRHGLVPASETFLDRAPSELMPYVYIQELLADGLMTRFMGTALVAYWKQDTTGRYFAEASPRAERDRVKEQVELITSHPCGLVQHGRFATASGRALDYEAVLLPLAVQAGRPPRAAIFNQMLSAVIDEDGLSGFRQHTTQSWIDLGAGVPSRPPIALVQG